MHGRSGLLRSFGPDAGRESCASVQGGAGRAPESCAHCALTEISRVGKNYEYAHITKHGRLFFFWKGERHKPRLFNTRAPVTANGKTEERLAPLPRFGASPSEMLCTLPAVHLIPSPVHALPAFMLFGRTCAEGVKGVGSWHKRRRDLQREKKLRCEAEKISSRWRKAKAQVLLHRKSVPLAALAEVSEVSSF